MKTKQFISIALFTLLGLMGWMPKANGQESLNKIREHYYDVKQRIAQQEGLEMPKYYQMNVMTILPGTGGHHKEINMYFSSREDHEIWPSNWLELVTTSYDYAVRQYYEEYLFTPNGDLSFIFVRTPDVEFGKEYEFRFYFDDGLFLVTIRSREVGGSDFVEVFSDTEVPTQYLSFYYEYLNNVSNYHHLFSAMDNTVRN